MTLRIDDFHWIDIIVDKIIAKHAVDPDDVESALLNTDPRPYVWRKADRYLAFAQAEDDGDYLFVVFDIESANVARVISARRMTTEEKSRFRKISKLS